MAFPPPDDLTIDNLGQIDFTCVDEETVKVFILKAHGIHDPSPTFYQNVMQQLPTCKHLVPGGSLLTDQGLSYHNSPSEFETEQNDANVDPTEYDDAEIEMSGAVFGGEPIIDWETETRGRAIPYKENSASICERLWPLVASSMPYGIVTLKDIVCWYPFKDATSIDRVPKGYCTTNIGLWKASQHALRYTIHRDNHFLNALGAVGGLAPTDDREKKGVYLEDLGAVSQ